MDLRHEGASRHCRLTNFWDWPHNRPPSSPRPTPPRSHSQHASQSTHTYYQHRGRTVPATREADVHQSTSEIQPVTLVLGTPAVGAYLRKGIHPACFLRRQTLHKSLIQARAQTTWFAAIDSAATTTTTPKPHREKANSQHPGSPTTSLTTMSKDAAPPPPSPVTCASQQVIV